MLRRNKSPSTWTARENRRARAPATVDFPTADGPVNTKNGASGTSRSL
jgi:hypothetical protein